MLIRWVILLFMKSPSYQKESGFMKLSHESTIKSYLHFTDSKPDINNDVIKIIADVFKVNMQLYGRR